MAIRGFFRGAGRIPMLGAWVNLPRLGLLAPVEFMVDTGAEQTVLHPKSAAEIKLDHRLLTHHVDLTGVGGSGSYATEFALLAFGDGSSLFYIASTLFIAEATSVNRGYPSLLGRDVLSHFRMTYDPTNDILEFDPLSFDHRSDAPTP